ncbi:MAG TPA: hypothetical protein VN685_11840 [Rhizomicrobium sp.]|nr:hypothetical protein [Rhizomicrobium sp.]
MPLDGTYAGLQASVADWLNRADLAAVVPDFIALAEAQISRRLLMDGPVRMMMARDDLSIGAEFVAVPSDFMGARTIYVSGADTASGLLPLQIATPDEINDLKAFHSGQDGPPRRFAVVGTSLQFWPWNGGSVAGELTYWQRVPALSVSGGNWLLSLHPDAYIYGALLQAAPYLKDDARVAVWGELFQAVLADIVAADRIERGAAQVAMPPRPIA